MSNDTELDLSLDEIISRRNISNPFANSESEQKRKSRKARSKWERFEKESDSEDDNEDEKDSEGESDKGGEDEDQVDHRSFRKGFGSRRPARCQQADDDEDSDDEPIAIPMYDCGVDEDLCDKYAGRERRAAVVPSIKRRRVEEEVPGHARDLSKRSGTPTKTAVTPRAEAFVFQKVKVDAAMAVNMSLDAVIRASREPVPVKDMPKGLMFKPRLQQGEEKLNPLMKPFNPFMASQTVGPNGKRKIICYDSDNDVEQVEEPGDVYFADISTSSSPGIGNRSGFGTSRSSMRSPVHFDRSSPEENIGPRGYDEEKVKTKLNKYWNNRYLLFSKFDDGLEDGKVGIKLDYESWYSVTPEYIAKTIAVRCSKRNPNGIIVDGFCGCGGNTIQFALTSAKKVIAIDIDPKKIEFAKHNARIYNVERKIKFMVGDFMEIASQLKADVVFLSPPWGGPSYAGKTEYDLMMDLDLPVNGHQLFQAAKQISENIAYYLPKTTKPEQLIRLGGGRDVEIEDNRLENRIVARTAYYGNLVCKPTRPEEDDGW